MNKKPEYDDYLICPICQRQNVISKTQHLGTNLCECQTFCTKCKHTDYWAYGFYESKQN